MFEDESDICSTCGLEKPDLCVCEEVAKTESRIKVSIDKRKWGKEYTIVSGLDPKEFDLKELATELKSRLACGGSAKGGNIELQGNHIYRITPILEKLGFAPETIDIRS